MANIENTKSAIAGQGKIIKTSPLAHALNVANAGMRATWLESLWLAEAFGWSCSN
ncbi:internal (core) protein [Enterobacter phage 04_vB_Eclo_IJM]|nr:internal (core) protein [Enterobacter phage 04_vB_Eclo_IJM]